MRNVVPFAADPRLANWRGPELRQIVSALKPVLKPGRSGRWEVGTTEVGDPQFYVLGPEPEEACEICISRVGRIYVLEDHEGQVLFDGENLEALAERAVSFLRGSRVQIAARVLLAWVAARQFVHDKVEALMAEGEDMLVHVAPQFAALV